MPGFQAIEQRLSDACMSMFGEPAVLTPQSDDAQPIATLAVVNSHTQIVGDFGNGVDPRWSVRLPKADVGLNARGSTLVVLGVTYTVDRLIDGSDDGYEVSYYITRTSS